MLGRLVAVLAVVAIIWPGVGQAETVRLTFVHVNDIYEHRPQAGMGGLAELLSAVEAERGRQPNLILSFGGDLLSPSLASNLTKGAHMVSFLNGMGVAAAVPGNHEFDFGPAVFAQRIAESRFPWVGTNVLAADGKPFGGMVSTRMVEVGGVKVGFLGVLTADTTRLSHAQGVMLSPPIPAAEAATLALRAQGARMVVALTHLDLADDRRLALKAKGIDLVLGGHDHDPVSVKEDGPLVLKSGQNAQWLGIVDMDVETGPVAEGKSPARLTGWRFVPVTGFPPHPSLTPLAAQVDALLGEALDAPLAILETALDTRTSVVRGEEAAMGNLFSDALRAHFNADAALINGGGLRGNRLYSSGESLTRRDILTEMPFGNAVMELEISGSQLLAALEHGLSAIEAKAGRFPQLSGMTVVYDPSRPAGKRVISARVGPKPLAPKSVYRLATTDYLGHGGDGYGMLPQAKVLVDASGGPLLANVVSDYLAARGKTTPKVEGRVTPVR